jgi:hypothetical protein
MPLLLRFSRHPANIKYAAGTLVVTDEAVDLSPQSHGGGLAAEAKFRERQQRNEKSHSSRIIRTMYRDN